ncbi:MAG TPA: hypothetical protein EYP60_06735 [bacterium (Candidatus Stahlbacteria)]|nr:hypothetical protein [Candidatus Stahlbacteria bacterium]
MTPHEIIDKFRWYDLPVTDDRARIFSENFQKKYKMYRHLTEEPDPLKRQKGKTGCDIGTELRSKFKQLVAEQREHFFVSVKPMVETLRIVGKREVTPEFVSGLERNAKEHFRFEESLADRIVREFLKNQDLTIGHKMKDVNAPYPITHLKVEPRVGSVKISWKLPRQNCEGICVERVEVGEKEKKREITEPKHRILREKIVDDDVQPEKRYRYLVYSLYRGISSEPSSDEVLIPGEIKNLRGKWNVENNQGGVELEWQAPSQCLTVCIFRKKGGIPIVRNDLTPGDSATEQCFWTNKVKECEQWVDRDVVGNTEYHYLLIADYGNGVHSEGIEYRIRTPEPPPMVKEVEAEYNPELNEVRITWKPVSIDSCEYLVLRKKGNSAATVVKEGDKTIVTDGIECVDGEVEPGCQYIYTVFTRRKGLLSSGGKASKPVLILAEVSNLNVEVGIKAVTLTWQSPKNVKNIVVRRSEISPPEDIHDGNRIEVEGSQVKDTDLQEQTTYHYLISCIYTLPGGITEISKGVRRSATVLPPPPQLDIFSTGYDEAKNEVICTWSSITTFDIGDVQVKVIRCPEKHNYKRGQILKVSELSKLGRIIEAISETKAVDREPSYTEPFYISFTVRGVLARVGPVRRCVPIPDVKNLRAFAVEHSIRLTWDWPQNCEKVVVVRRKGQWPDSPDDPQADFKREVLRNTYDQDGESFLDKSITLGESDEYYKVYAKMEKLCSLGKSEGCSYHIPPLKLTRIDYQIRVRKNKLIFDWEIKGSVKDIEGFALVVDKEPPLYLPSNGAKRIWEWPEPNGNKKAKGHKQFSIGLEVPNFPFYCKLFLKNPNQSWFVRIGHPESITRMIQGQKHWLFSRNSALGVREISYPKKKVLCPHHFGFIPFWKVEYSASLASLDEKTKGYQLPFFQKLCALFWPKYQLPNNIRGPKGEVLHYKHCPAPLMEKGKQIGGGCGRELPYTVGKWPTAFVGLIGGPESGKSHLIVTLVKKMEDRVAMTPIMDSTRDKLTDWTNRLYKKGMALTITERGGEEAPWIFNVGLGNNKSITCAFYDRSGESFTKSEYTEQDASYVAKSAGLLFLVDPLQCSRVVNILYQKGVEFTSPEVSYEGILGAVIEALNKMRAPTKGKKLRRPLGVVVAKADLLRKSQLIPPNSLWSAPVFHEGGFYDVGLHVEINDVIRAFLREYEPGLLNQIEDNFEDYAFFAVSSTGCAPKDGRFPRIAPWRVEEPVLWLLYRLGLLPER